MLWLLGLALAGAAVAAAASQSNDDSPGFKPIDIRLLPLGGTPKDAPALPANATQSDLDAAFAAAQARSEASRKASEDAARAKLDQTTTDAGEALAFLGPAGVTAAIAWKSLTMWGYDWAQKLAHFLYGDPGWNSPEQISRAKNEVARMLAVGFAPRPYMDDLDAGAQGYSDRIAEQNTALRGPNMPPQWGMFLDWVRSHPDDSTLRDATWLGLFPMHFAPTRNQSASLGRLLAKAFGRDPQRAQAAAINAWDSASKLGSEYRFLDAETQARKLNFIVQSILAS